MFDWLLSSRSNSHAAQISAFQIHPNSTLHIESTPNDPHTASNIAITAFVSKTKRSIVPIRVQWSRSRDLQSLKNVNSIYPVERIQSHRSNTYMCQPADLGCYLHVKVISLDESIQGQAQGIIGPIRVEVMVKRLMEGAMFAETLLQQVVLVDGETEKNGTIRLNTKTMEFRQDQSELTLNMDYNISEPKIEVNPKDNLKVYLRFEQDEEDRVQKYIARVFDRPLPTNLSKSRTSNSRAKIFKSAFCPNKFEFKFLSRHTRDLFLFVHKAFICKEMLKGTVIIEKLQKMQMLGTEQDYQKFLQFMALREQINRLVELAKELQNDRNKKITDLNQLEESIGELTLTYMKIIEEKCKESNVDLNKSYSEVSMKRQEHLNRKNFRELRDENENLKLRVRDLTEEIELIKFFKKDDHNDSNALNQTANNPFLRKHIKESAIRPVREKDRLLDEPFYPSEDGNTKNMLELSRSYAKLVHQNQKLRHHHIQRKNSDRSRDVLQILDSLQQEPEQKNSDDLLNLVRELRRQNDGLKQRLSEMVNPASRVKAGKLSVSLAHQNKNVLQGMSISMISNQPSQYESLRTIPINESMTSQTEIRLLEDKFVQISHLNKKILQDNARLRKERDYCREAIKLYKIKERQWEQHQKNRLDYIHGNNLDTSVVFKVKEQNEALINQRNSLRKKIDSLMRQANQTQHNPEGVLNLKDLDHSSNTLQRDALRRRNSELIKEVEDLREQNTRLRAENQTLKKQTRQQLFTDQSIKLKRINGQLLEEIKSLKIQLQKRMDIDLHSSRVIELENQVNYLKAYDGSKSEQEKITQLKRQLNQYSKQIEKLKIENLQKQYKLQSHGILIERLMSEGHEKHNSSTDKDSSKLNNQQNKSKSQYCKSENSESVEKYRKKIKELQEEVLLLRRSSDALNRSRDLSMDMDGYYEQQMVLLRRQMNTLIEENQRISKMCDKYSKDLREANKFKKQMLQKVNKQSTTPSLDLNSLLEAKDSGIIHQKGDYF